MLWAVSQSLALGCVMRRLGQSCLLHSVDNWHSSHSVIHSMRSVRLCSVSSTPAPDRTSPKSFRQLRSAGFTAIVGDGQCAHRAWDSFAFDLVAPLVVAAVEGGCDDGFTIK